MKKKTLFNPTKLDILDYRIAEAVLTPEGDTTIDNATGLYKTTNNTLEWSIRAGETLSFPVYVADYLKKIYDFLEVVDEDTPKVEEKTEPQQTVVTEAKPQDGVLSCKYCGRNFKNTRALGLHIGATHTEKIL